MPVVSDYTALLGNGFGTWNLNTHKAVFVSFSFPDSVPPEYVSTYGLLSTAGAASFQPFTTTEKDLIRAALQIWGEASGIYFIEVPGQDGDIRFSKYDMSIDFGSGVTGYGTAAGRGFGTLSSSDIAYNGDVILDLSAIDMRVVLHEIGHVIGLKHPFDGSSTLDPSLDTAANTVMGYSNVGFTGGLGIFDAQATNFLYGPQGSEHTLQWSWDPLTSTLTQTGSGIIAGMGNANDVIFGSSGNDTLLGWGGNDTLHIGVGDKAFGGAGDDTFVVHASGSGTSALINAYAAIRTGGLVQGEGGLDTLDFSQFTFTDTLPSSQLRGLNVSANQLVVERVIGSSDRDLIQTFNDGAFETRVYIDGGPGDDTMWLMTTRETVSIRPGGGSDNLGYVNFRTDPLDSSKSYTMIDLSEIPGIDDIHDLLPLWQLVPDGQPTPGLTYGFNFGDGTTLGFGAGGTYSFTDAEDRVAFSTGTGAVYFAPNNFIFSSLFTEGSDTRVLSEPGKTWLAKAGHDNITGTSGFDIIHGQAGNDTIDGGAGADQIYGGDNEDTIDYDPADTVIDGGAGTDTLRVLNAAAPTSFNLASHNLERAIVIQDDTSGQWWQEITDTYNASWQRTNRDTLADDGRTIQTTFDVSAGGTGVNWQYISDYRNPFGTLTNQDGVFDDGSTFAKAYDYAPGTATDGVDDWLAEYTYFFRNITDQQNGLVRNVEGFADDGRKFTQTNDIDTDQAWTFQTNWYETDGVTLDFLEIRWDNGTTQIIPY